MLTECRLCGSQDLTLWMQDGRNRDLNYYRCGNCSLWNYDLECGMDQTQYTAKYVSPEDPRHKSNRVIAQSWKFLRDRVPGPGSILDIGCGNAALLHFARKEGWEVHGMELSESMAKAIEADQGIPVAVANFLDYEPAPGEAYDVVVLRHVLEHLEDPRLAMRKIGGLLRDNGVAFLELPNTGSFAYASKRIMKNLGLRNSKYSADWRPGHCNEFCRQAFDYLVEATGFELQEWRTYSNKPLADRIYGVLPVASKVRVLARKLPSEDSVSVPVAGRAAAGSSDRPAALRTGSPGR
jgi:2-polyprenyl-3-methyl-5-hydroxy-6-metoxy-1,4-benzoquinol methylase